MKIRNASAALALVALTVSVVFGVSNPGQWKQLKSMPRSRQEMPAIHLDGKIYVAGGMNKSPCCNALPWFDVYDIASNTWKQLPDMPHSVNHCGIAALDGKVYVISGWGTGGTPTATNKCFVFDVASEKWSSISNIPVKSAAPGVVVYQKRIWVFGGQEVNGFDKAGHKNVQVYDPKTDSWEKVNSAMPHGRLHIGAGIVGNKVYLSPGRKGSINRMKDVVCQQFDLAKADQGAAAWKRMNDLPSDPRTGYVSNFPVVNGWVYYFSGEPMTKTSHRFKPTADGGVWEQVTDVPHDPGVHGIGPVAVGNKIYICGGGLRGGAQYRTDKVYVYTITEGPTEVLRPMHYVNKAQPMTTPSYYTLTGRIVEHSFINAMPTASVIIRQDAGKNASQSLQMILSK